MDTFDAIYARHAVKHYDPEHVMPEPDLNNLLDAVIQSPTSFNMQNWRFVVVRDKALRTELQAAAMNQAQVSDASVLFILTADLKAYADNPTQYWQHAPQEVAELLSNWMVPFYDGKPELERDEAMRSCGIAAQTLMLAAKAMGYESCPMIGFDPVKVAELINLPENHVIGMMLPIGKGTKPAFEKTHQLALDAVVVHDRF